MRMKAITQGALPRLTQLWIVPRCTSTSPAFRWMTELVDLHIDLARHDDGIIDGIRPMNTWRDPRRKLDGSVYPFIDLKAVVAARTSGWYGGGGQC